MDAKKNENPWNSEEFRSWTRIAVGFALVLICLRCSSAVDVAVELLRRIGFLPPVQLQTTIERTINGRPYKVEIHVNQGPGDSSESVWTDLDETVLLGTTPKDEK